MNAIVVVLAGAVLLLIAGRLYGRWIGRVFELRDDHPCPSETRADGREYVASPTQVVFAHHFASIAGAGPIVGPIIAIAFGWGPAWLWIVIGGIFFGAVHDMTALCVSLREGGRTIAEIARRALGQTGFLLFIVFLLLVLALVNAIFLNLSAASLTSLVPFTALGLEPDDTVLRSVDVGGVAHAQVGGIATTSVFVMTAFAPLLGLLVRRGVRGLPAFAAAAAICLVGIVVGFLFPIRLADDVETARNAWRWMLAVYVFVGCWIPVWVILQPRDFCNVQILYVGIALLALGAVVGGLREPDATALDPARLATVEEGTTRIGPMWPFLMITIACGAISGFHSLVASGTTVKQVRRETDCRRIGYGAMLLESFLALLVLVTVVGRLAPDEYTAIMWPESGGGNAVLAFALAAGRSFTGLGIPADIGTVLGILVIEGFLVTTLDTSVRLGRYLFEELWKGLFGDRTPAWLLHPLTNTATSVGLMLVIAFSSVYDEVWTIFGAGNQLIGALALTTVTVYLVTRHRAWLFTAIPALIMTVTTMTALALRVRRDIEAENHPLAIVGACLFALAIGFAVIAFLRVRTALRAAALTRDVS